MVQSALNAAGLRRAKFAAAKAVGSLPKRKKDAVAKDILSLSLYIYSYPTNINIQVAPNVSWEMINICGVGINIYIYDMKINSDI